jgi:hypothetical protein
MMTAKEAYEVARKVRPDVGRRPVSLGCIFDYDLKDRLQGCFVFEVPPDGSVIGCSFCVAVNRKDGTAFEFGYGE